MSSEHHPAWLGAFRAVCHTVLYLYPRAFREACGAELIDTSLGRVRQTSATSTRIRTYRFALTELTSLLVSATQMRRSIFESDGHPVPLRAFRDDVGQAIAGLRRKPGSAGIVVLLIGLAVGLTSSVFSVIEGIIVEPLPFTRSDEIVHVWTGRPWQNETRGLIADTQFRSLREQSLSFAGLSALWMVSGRILGGEQPVHTDVARVSANFFDILDVPAYIGRTFAPGEDQPGAPWVAVLDYDYWIKELGADPHVLGKRLVVGWPEMEIIGVLPPGFHFRPPPELGDHRSPEVWIPWRRSSQEDDRTNGGTLAVVGRTREGFTLREARQDLKRMSETEDRTYYGNKGFAYRVERLQSAWTADMRLSLGLLAGAGGFVLLIATANATTLLLARNQSRRRELGVRRALGASSFRVARLLIFESLVLTLSGGMLGVALADWGTRGLLALVPADLPGINRIDVDGSVLAFGLTVSILAGLAAATVSIIQLGRTKPEGALRGSRGRGTESTSNRRTQRMFVTLQVACSVVLLFETGLFIQTLAHIQSSDLGFQEDGRLTFSTYLMEEYRTHESQIAFYRELRERISHIPGVRSVSGTSALPLSGTASRAPASTFARRGEGRPESFSLVEPFSVLSANGLDALSGDGWMVTQLTAAQPNYFTAVGILLLAGRGFENRDGRGDPLRIIVDETLADRFWSRETAVGQQLWVAGGWREVIGVAHNTVMSEPRAGNNALVYLPYDQIRSGRVSVVVHSTGDPNLLLPSIRQVLTELDPMVPIADIRTLGSIVDKVTARDRFTTLLMTVFAGAAILMVALGVYGALAVSVRERAWEVTIRLAVGMGKVRLAGLVLAEGVLPVILGLIIGMTVTFPVSRVIQSELYGITAHDQTTMIVVSLLIVVVSLLASWVPAVRALSINPAQALLTD